MYDGFFKNEKNNKCKQNNRKIMNKELKSKFLKHVDNS